MAAKQVLSSWGYMAGVGIICGLTLAGCSKKEEEKQPPVQQDTQSTETTAANLSCDNPAVIQSLSNSIQSSITAQVQEQIRNYAQQTGASIDMSSTNSAIGSILVDIANPKELPQANTNNSTQTCQASLSLTLPSEEIYRANQLYAAANGVSLQEMLASQNIGLNNNMLVDDGFTYVVGEQAGEVLAKVVGQPSILRVVSDVVAKSQLQIVMDNKRNEALAAHRDSISNAPIRQQRQQPQRRPEPTTQPQPPIEIETDSDKTLASPQWSENGNLQGQTKIIEKTIIGDTDNQNGQSNTQETVTTSSTGNSSTNTTGNATSSATDGQGTATRPAKSSEQKNSQSADKPAKSTFKTPKNDDIEIVIIEENTTY